MIGLGWKAWSSTGAGAGLGGSTRCCLCTGAARGAEEDSACVELLRFRLLSAVEVLGALVVTEDDLGAAEADAVLADCLFFVFVDGDGEATSFIDDDDFRRVTVGFTTGVLVKVKE